MLQPSVSSINTIRNFQVIITCSVLLKWKWLSYFVNDHFATIVNSVVDTLQPASLLPAQIIMGELVRNQP